MLKVSASSAIELLVEAMLPRHSGPDKGLAISLDVSMENLDAGPNDLSQAECKLRFVFQRNSNYTKVFSAINKGDWEFIGDHDSCWRDSVSSKCAEVYFDLAKKLGKTPIRLNDRTSFQCLTPRIVEVEVLVNREAKIFKDKATIRIL